MSLSLLTFGLTPNADAQAPAAPTAVAATAVTGKVTLTWAAPTGTPAATSYAVYRATASGAETPYASGVPLTSYTDTGVTDGTAYFYRVYALAAGVRGPSAGEAKATPLDAPQGISRHRRGPARRLRGLPVLAQRCRGRRLQRLSECRRPAQRRRRQRPGGCAQGGRGGGDGAQAGT